MLNNKQQANKSDLSVFGKSLSIKGDFQSTGSVEILGSVEGNAEISNVSIRDGGSFKGKINSQSLLISGHFDGDIVSDKVIISKTASVAGNITYGTIAVEDGAVLNCKIKKK